MNLSELFFKKSKAHLDKTAYTIFQGQERKDIRYLDVVSLVIRYAGYLSDITEKGERVALCSENRYEWGIAYLAIVTVGGIAVPIDAELGAEEIRNIIQASESKTAFCSNKTLDKLKSSGSTDTNVINFDAVPVQLSEEKEIDLSKYLKRITFDDIASIIYTSGTTGVPKGVMLTHRNFYSNAMAVIETGILTERDNVLSVLPLHHTYAFMCTFLVPLIFGGTITYPASLKGPDLTHAIKGGGVTILVGVPQLLDLFYSAFKRNMEALPFLKRALAGVLIRTSRFVRHSFDLNLGKILFGSVHKRFGRQFRLMASGGASLPVDTMKGLEAFGFTIVEGYGLTETSPVVTFNPLNRRKAGSVGKPLPGVQIKIRKEPGDEFGPQGEILIQGDMVMKGYYNMPEETEKVLEEGWFCSGDLGYIDKEGYLFVTGRKKEVIVLSSGKNIYPEEIEEEYRKIPLVKDICVLDKREGDAVMLYSLIVPDFEYAKASKIANLYEALKWDIHGVSLKLPQYMRLKGFTLYSEPFPRTRLGKLRRYMIRDIFSRMEAEKPVHDEAPVEELDSVAEKVIECVKRFVAEGVVVRTSDNLELDLGIDSLKRVELTVELEKAFSISLPETFLIDVQSVSEIYEKVKEIEQTGEEGVKEETKTFKDLLMRKPDEKQIGSIGLKQNIFASLFVWSVLKIIKVSYRAYLRSEVKGIENIPETPFILVSNHASYLDSFFIASHVPYRVFKNLFFQGAQKYFESRLMKVFARIAHVIPIDPDSFFASAFSLSAFVLNEKRALCIFPEGGRSFDGSVMSFRKGIGILSVECGVPLVPVRIRGTYESMPRRSIFPKRTKVSLTVGLPIHLHEIEALNEQGGDFYQTIADLARERVVNL